MPPPTPVATAFVVHDGDVLLLRRSSDAPEYPDRWSGVSGVVEPGETPRAAAVREVAEETGLEVDVEAAGEPVPVVDGDRAFRVHPFRVRARTRSVERDRENQDHVWVDPAAIGERDTVPELRAAWERVG